MNNLGKQFTNLLNTIEDNWELFRDGVAIRLSNPDGIDRAIQRVDPNYGNCIVVWDEEKQEWKEESIIGVDRCNLALNNTKD